MDQADTLFLKAQKYLQSAALLYELEDFDSSVSRSYFSMFYAAQACLLAEAGGIPSRQSIRSAFIQRFVDSGRLPSHAADILREAADLQEVADYAHDFAITSDSAARILQEAEAFVNSLAQLTRQYV
jgi:uncharacterized protein (UPF0332 family)